MDPLAKRIALADEDGLGRPDALGKHGPVQPQKNAISSSFTVMAALRRKLR